MAHFFASLESIPFLLVNLLSFLAQLHNGVDKLGREHHNTVVVTNEQVSRMNPQIALDLDRNVEF